MLIHKKQKIFLYACILLLGAVLMPQYILSATNGGNSIDEMQRNVTEKKEKVEELKNKVRKLKQSINQKRSLAASLSNQLAILADRIKQAETEIELTDEQIGQIDLEIAQTNADISQTEQEIDDNQNTLVALLQSHFQIEQKNSLEIILTSDSISDYFNQIVALSRVEERAQSVIVDLKTQKQKLALKKKNLSDKQISLQELNDKQKRDKEILAQQQAARAVVLGETKNSEDRFQYLLQKARAEQIRVNTEIQGIEQTIRQRLESLGSAGLDKLGPVKRMIDPVTPRRITTYFYDPHYPFRYLFEHPGLDLAVPQGSPVKAATSGFVAKVKDGGLKSYSYVMLVHANGISTVYMHVSKILVKENQFVNQGDIIALSGGTPGTPGAGRLSTGPHIQFEVRINGSPVDPLKYLNK